MGSAKSTYLEKFNVVHLITERSTEEVQATKDPWHLRLEGLRGKSGTTALNGSAQ
jgi:hypothetical protein